jgi:hypothetical protein
MADHMNLNYRDFNEMHPEECVKMQRLMLDYVGGMKEVLRGQSGNVETQAGIQTDENDFPIVPDIAIVRKYGKRAAAGLMRRYLKQHYSE